MIRKFFPFDKNYVLKEAQSALEATLLSDLIEYCKAAYEELHNPLQLEDDFSLKIRNYQPNSVKPLSGFYETMAAVYRYKFGENQLEFLWDGQSHFEKYRNDWESAFGKWIVQLACNPQFIQAVLDLSVFLPDNRRAELAENRMNAALLDFFSDRQGFPELKFRKGILKVA